MAKAKSMSYRKVTQYIIDFVEEYDLYDLEQANSAMGSLIDYIGKRQRPDLYPELEETKKGRCGETPDIQEKSR